MLIHEAGGEKPGQLYTYMCMTTDSAATTTVYRIKHRQRHIAGTDLPMVMLLTLITLEFDISRKIRRFKNRLTCAWTEVGTVLTYTRLYDC